MDKPGSGPYDAVIVSDANGDGRNAGERRKSLRSLHDKRSHLSFDQACKLLGDRGAVLIMNGGQYDIDLDAQVRFDRSRFRLTLGATKVVIRLDPHRPRPLSISCNRCQGACDHQGAALSLILEEKLALGLAVSPKERVPLELLDEAALVKHALDERRQRARGEKMRLKAIDSRKRWTDYVVTNRTSGKSYRVALRGWQPGESYCTCPDFR
jgi:hypothetical protein